MRKCLLFLALMLAWLPGFGCITCNRQIREGIYNSAFFPNLLTMFSAFIVLGILVAALSYVSVSRHRRRLAAQPGQPLLPDPVPLTTAAIILGIGLGGFADGIVLHQILQWHEMLSSKIPATTYTGKSINMFWDGIFHAFCLLVVLTGIVLLWKAARRTGTDRSGKLLAGGLWFGWGLFNIVEGIINHQLLKLHNVMEFSARPEVFNLSFLAISVLFLAFGYGLMQKHTAPK